MKSAFLPKFVYDNPYITQLIDNLETVGIELNLPSDSSSQSFFIPLLFSQEKVDFIHLHWLHPFFQKNNSLINTIKLVIIVLQLVLLKLSNIKIVWTVHNLKNHEKANLIFERTLSIVVAELADAIITHCEIAKAEAVKHFLIRNQAKVFVVPNGNYIGFYENTIDKSTARERLGLKPTSVVFTFLGEIRLYKGIFELIDTFHQLPEENIELVIAGRVHNNSQEMTDRLREIIGDDHRIKFSPGFVPNDEIQLYMNACDTVIVPYRDILTSSSVLLAMSFARACIAPRRGCIGEIIDDVGLPLLYEINDNNGLINTMRYAIEKRHELLLMGQHNFQLAEHYGWQKIAAMTANVYRSCQSNVNK
ncbi:glycosyltransferase family 4 protein [Nostoc sp. FACHB-110]|nr:glycosyltransferase family 4 protein [Nostoc sp. FACHB-110]